MTIQPPINLEARICEHCGQPFTITKKELLTVKRFCKPSCQRKSYYRAHAKRHIEKVRLWQKKNYERHKSICRKFYENNKEKYLAYGHDYYVNVVKKRKEQQKNDQSTQLHTGE